MDIDLAALPGDVKTLQRMVRLLATERTSLSEAQAEIERLHLIIKKLQRSQFGRRAERLDDDQLQLGFFYLAWPEKSCDGGVQAQLRRLQKAIKRKSRQIDDGGQEQDVADVLRYLHDFGITTHD
jgi:hypothetical protein